VERRLALVSGGTRTGRHPAYRQQSLIKPPKTCAGSMDLRTDGREVSHVAYLRLVLPKGVLARRRELQSGPGSQRGQRSELPVDSPGASLRRTLWLFRPQGRVEPRDSSSTRKPVSELGGGRPSARVRPTAWRLRGALEKRITKAGNRQELTNELPGLDAFQETQTASSRPRAEARRQFVMCPMRVGAGAVQEEAKAVGLPGDSIGRCLPSFRK
jgi:hypothetical protein